MESGIINRPISVSPSLRVLHLIPGSSDDEVSMVFVKRQIRSLESAGISSFRLFIEDRRSMRALICAIFQIRRAINEFHPTVVHAHYGTITSVVAALGVSGKGVPLVITFRGSDINLEQANAPIVSRIKNFMSQVSSLWAARIIVVSEELRDRLWWRKSVATVIPTGVDIDQFRPVSKELSRQQLGWNKNDTVLIFNASNSANKRADLAMKAFEGVKAQIPTVRLVVLRSDVSPDQMPLVLAAADCLLLLSDREGSPNIVKEAMACNLPIVSFDVGDVKELLEGVKQSEVVSRDMDVLVRTIVRILRCGERSNGRDKVVYISTPRIATRILETYESIVSR